MAILHWSVDRPKWIFYWIPKEEQYTKKNQEVNAQVRLLHQIYGKWVQWHDRHLFDMSVLNWLEQTLDRRKEWIGCITPAYEAWNVLQAIKNIAIWPFSPPQINIMKGGHMFDYNQFHESAFLERKCNFRLELMYFKSFLSPLVLLGGVVVVPPMWFSSWGWAWDEDWHRYAAAMAFCFCWKALTCLKVFLDYPLIGVKRTAISCQPRWKEVSWRKGKELIDCICRKLKMQWLWETEMMSLF